MRLADFPAGGRLAILGAAGAAIAGVWTMLASFVFLLGTGLLPQFAHPFYQWWLYLPYAGQNQTVKLWLAISGGGATLFLLVLVVVRFSTRPRGPSLRAPLFGARPQAVMRGTTDNHGHADWLARPALRRLFPGPDPAFGGIVVGEAYRVDQDRVAERAFDPANRKTWGKGGKAELLVDPCRLGPTHSLIIAGSGGFKSTSAIATLLHWTGSAVILDPSCELGPMLATSRTTLGHTVATLDPLHAGDCGFNVLDWIDPDAPDAETNVQAVAGWICGEIKPNGSGENAEFFHNWGRHLVLCLLAHMLWSDDCAPGDKTLRTLREAVVTPEGKMRDVLRGIHAISKSSMARQIAGSLMEMKAEETFSGIYANANEATFWLSVPSYADLVSGNSFHTAQIADGKLTAFVQIPLKSLQSTPALGRVIIGALLNAVYEANGAVQGRVLFLLDEVARLGRMGILEQSRDAGRKYGITLQLLYQSVGQIVEQWGQEGRRAWYDGVSWRGYAAVQDMDTAREVSAAAGEFGVLATSEGDNSGRSGVFGKMGSRSKGRNTSHHEIHRALIKPEEMTQNARTDEIFIIARGTQPIRCGRAIYFRRPEMVEQVEASRFFRAAAE
jgi:type IV secretion system protein VirD4